MPEHWEVSTMSAFGRLPPHDGDEMGVGLADHPRRQRRAVEEIVWSIV